MLVVFAIFNRQANYQSSAIQVFYEVPRLRSGAQLGLKCASSYENYFVAFTSDQQLDNLKITVDLAYNGASRRGGLIFAVKSVTIRISTVSFLRCSSSPQMVVALLNDYLNLYNSSLKIQNNSFVYTKALITTIAANSSEQPILLQRNQMESNLAGSLPCTTCQKAESTVEDFCWGCLYDTVLDDPVQRTCKCRYSNAFVSEHGDACVTMSATIIVTQYDDSGIKRGYLLDCSSNKQINISVDVYYPKYQSFSVLRNDSCNPANLYVVGAANFTEIDPQTFLFGGLTYKLQQGATYIRINLTISTDYRFHYGGMLYASASDLTNAVTIDGVTVSATLSCSYYASVARLPFGGFIGNVYGCAGVTIKNSQVYGLLFNITYWHVLGIVVGQASASALTITNFYIGPLQGTHISYNVDPALGDWNQVTLPCKGLASEALKPSFQLYIVAQQYDSKFRNTKIVGTYLSYIGGLLGYSTSSKMTAKNVIAQFDADAYCSSGPYAGIIAGYSVYSNLTVSNTYGTTYMAIYRYVGGVGYIDGGTSSFVMAMNLSMYGYYNGGAIGCMSSSATVEIRVGQNCSFTSGVWYNGVVGQVNVSSVLTVHEAIGKIVYSGGTPYYSSTLCGNICNSTLNGKLYANNMTSVNDSSISKINQCS